MLSILKCPVCQLRLERHVAAAVCEKGHSFDIARQGYVNLLLPDTRRSAEPGDSPDMMRSRRAFLQEGFYEPLASAATAAITTAIGNRAQLQIADLGCGEGYYLAHLKRTVDASRSAPHQYYGVDISRTGIRMATAYDRSVTWIVASVHNSPFLPASLDAILSMFAPAPTADFRRVIADDGALVLVAPGPDHLDALRAVIYASVEPHAADARGPLNDDAHFQRVSSSRVTYPIALRTHEQIMHLLAMTPFYWNISLETKARVEALTTLDVTVDAVISVYTTVT